ncbi:MAG: GNAT family N-acetyltransferase [Planctomycetota bacterium]
MKKLVFIIRRANKGDLDSIVFLSAQAAKLMHQISPAGFGKPLAEPVNIKKEKKWYHQAIKDKGKVIFVAEKNGKIIGYLMGIIEKYPDDLLDAPYLTLQYLCVDEKYRRSGVGKALMQEIEKWTSQQGLSTLELIVYNNNQPAKAFYKKLRYLPLEIRMAKKISKFRFKIKG